MKHTVRSRFLLLIAAIGLSAGLLMAQDTGSSPAPQSCPKDGKGCGKKDISPEMCARMKAAHEKALQDPELKKMKEELTQKMQAFHKAMKEAMLKADPGLKDQMEKFEKEHPWGKGRWGKGGGEKCDGKKGPGACANLSDTDKQKLKAAHQAAENDPTVIAAKTKKDSATNKEQRHAAAKEYRQAMKAAMLKADPSLQPILDKMGTDKGNPQPDASSAN